MAGKNRRANRSRKGKAERNAARNAAPADDDVIIIEPETIAKKARVTAPLVALPPAPPRSPSPSVVVLHQKGKPTVVEKVSQNSGSGEEESLATTVPLESEAQPTHQLDPPPPAAPSAEVVELQQKLAKVEDKFQRACRIAREEQLRAERAEGLLDTKRGIVADKKKAEVAQTAQIEQLKKDLALASAQLKASKAKEADPRETRKLVKANETLNREAAELRRVCQNGYAQNEQLKERIGFLTYQLEVSAGRADADRARIDHLSYRLSQYEHWTHQQNDYMHQNNSWRQW